MIDMTTPITDEIRAKYRSRLWLLRQKRTEFLARAARLQWEAEIERTMSLCLGIEDVIAPNETPKKKKSIYECVRLAAAKGLIRHAMLKRATGNASMRDRLFVHIEDARFYAVEMTYTERRHMGKYKVPLDEMRQKKAAS